MLLKGFSYLEPFPMTRGFWWQAALVFRRLFLFTRCGGIPCKAVSRNGLMVLPPGTCLSAWCIRRQKRRCHKQSVVTDCNESNSRWWMNKVFMFSYFCFFARNMNGSARTSSCVSALVFQFLGCELSTFDMCKKIVEHLVFSSWNLCVWFAAFGLCLFILFFFTLFYSLTDSRPRDALGKAGNILVLCCVICRTVCLCSA